MEQRAEFLKKLNGLVAAAKKQGDQITIDEVKDYFSEEQLSEEQLELVFDYLLAQKVVVKGYFKISEEEPLEYTEEEKVYLEEYLKDLEAFKEVGSVERETLFAKAMTGEQGAKNRLAEVYLPEVVEIAKEMYHPDIFIGDLIQEGNLGLILGINMINDVCTAHDTILEQIKQNMRLLIEEHGELSSRDKKMVEQVQLLDESITQLTEELGRKVTIDELSVYMGMSEEEINDILRLTGEEPEEEHAHEEEEEA